MRFVEGTTSDRIDREGGALSVGPLAILNQISGALDAAHALGLVHRDVKPCQHPAHRGEHAYLTDFGLMRRIQCGGDMTRDGEFIGTLD